MWCGIQANQLDSMNIDKLYSLAKLMNGNCHLSQSEGSLFITVQGLWDELALSLTGFGGTMVLLYTPISLWGPQGHCPSFALIIHQIN